MEFSIRDYIREIKNAVNARLDMLESLISSKNVDKVESLNFKIQDMHFKIVSLEEKIDELMSSKKEELPSIIGAPDYDNASNHSVTSNFNKFNNVMLTPKSDTKQIHISVPNEEIQLTENHEEEEEEEQVEEEEEEQVEEEEEEEKEQVEEEEEEEQVEEEEEHVEEEEEEEEEQAEEEEEALTEFEYKGMVLYRDGENKVYQIDDEGELIDTPIGIWNEAKQKVVAIKN